MVIAGPRLSKVSGAHQENGLCYDARMKRTTITLPDDVALVLEREARRRRTSVSEVTREALKEHFGLGSDRPRHLPFAGIVASGTGDTAQRMDEILAEEWASFIEEDSGLAGHR